MSVPQDVANIQSPEEAARLAEVDHYRILDTGPDPRFEHVAKMVSRLLDAEYVLIALADRDRQWSKASIGLPVIPVPSEVSFSRKIVDSKSPLVVVDALGHPVFGKNPLVTGATAIRSYCGYPLINRNGFALGALSAFSRRPRQFTENEVQNIRDLAWIVVDELELHRSNNVVATSAMRLTQSEEEFRTTFENAVMGIAHVSTDGRWLKVNDHLCNLLGYSESELQHKNFRDITHPDDLETHDALIAGPLERQVGTYTLEMRYLTKSGETVWTSLTSALRLSETGEPLYFIVTVHDISARKAAEERTALLVGELNHRIKNTIATVASVATQTARASDSIDAFRDDFGNRVEAISAAHRLLNDNNWEWVWLDDLIREQAALGASGEVGRIEADGPRLRIQSQIALYLGLILHELATNARKHGALAHDDGIVTISWSTSSKENRDFLRLNWCESGATRFDGTAISKGFGGFLINKGLKIGLQGNTEIEPRSDGYCYNFEIPLRQRPERESLS